MNEREKRLENVIKQMLSPIKNIPLDLIINSISGCDVLIFDKKNEKHQDLLRNIEKAIKFAINEINKNGIKSNRPNEVGNYVEPFLKESLNTINGFIADTPIDANGRKISVGYPDIQLDYGNETCYIECKTFNITNVNTTQRSFYLSPSENFKITKTGLHFIVSFEMIVMGEEQKGDKTLKIYNVASWKILDAYHLDCDVKYEFNSDNRRMYSDKMILLEGKVG